MPNTNVNKVILGNETLIDISDTTATASDVAEGEVFYDASGLRSLGTGAYLPLAGGTMIGDIIFDDGSLQYDSETAYPTFIRSAWSTSSDETTLPVTPCFVLDTTEGGLYFCSGSGIVRINEGTDIAYPGQVRSDDGIAFNTAAGSDRGWINRSGDYIYILATDANGDYVGQYRFNMATWGIAYRPYSNGAWGSWGNYIYNANASRTANTVLAAPNGSAGAATFRALVAADIPSLAASKIGSGTFDAARIPSLAASKITSGTFDAARIPTLATSKISGLGGYSSKTISSATSVANNTYKSLGSIELSAGSFVLIGHVHFASNSTGSRWAYIATSASPVANDDYYYSSSTPAISSGSDTICTANVRNPTADTTYHLVAWQNSGSALNCRGLLQAIRIK